MKREFVVVSEVHHDKVYKPGKRIELTDEEAAPLLAVNAIAELEAKAPADGTDSAGLDDVTDDASKVTAEQLTKPLTEMSRAELVEYALVKHNTKIKGNMSVDNMLAAIAELEAKAPADGTTTQ